MAENEREQLEKICDKISQMPERAQEDVMLYIEGMAQMYERLSAKAELSA